MKVIYEEHEIERLEEAHKTLIEKGRGCLFPTADPDRLYNLSFKVTKPGLAEYLLVSLLYHELEDFNLGIDIVSINFDTLENKSEVKRKLYEAIETIIN